jgi:RNA polymerase sigma-70 factor, ECF subfamily
METPHSGQVAARAPEGANVGDNRVASTDGDITARQNTLRDVSDTSLVVNIARGHQRALAECYRRHGGQMYRLAQRLLGDDRLAEEAVQEVFLQFWQRPEVYDPERSGLRTWLLMRVHGRAVDALRAESARRTREERDATTPSAPAYDLEREVWDAEVADRVQRALSTLPEPERRAITLAFFGGHSYREVAQLLGRPEGTVKSQIRSGLSSLKRALADVNDPFGSIRPVRG